MESYLHSTRAQPRYDPSYDQHVLTNWICLIAEDRGLDAAAVSLLADIDEATAATILSGHAGTTPAAVLDTVLRRLERQPH